MIPLNFYFWVLRRTQDWGINLRSTPRWAEMNEDEFKNWWATKSWDPSSLHFPSEPHEKPFHHLNILRVKVPVSIENFVGKLPDIRQSCSLCTSCESIDTDYTGQKNKVLKILSHARSVNFGFVKKYHTSTPGLERHDSQYVPEPMKIFQTWMIQLTKRSNYWRL